MLVAKGLGHLDALSLNCFITAVHRGIHGEKWNMQSESTKTTRSKTWQIEELGTPYLIKKQNEPPIASLSFPGMSLQQIFPPAGPGRSQKR